MSRKAFKEGDLVWAKMRGHPHWPAKVERCPKGQSRPPGKLWVFFYGTHEHAWMLSAELCCYEENREKFRLPKKIKGFAEAIWEIEEDPDLVITLGKPPSRKRRRSALAKRGSHGNEDCHDGVVQDKVSSAAVSAPPASEDIQPPAPPTITTPTPVAPTITPSHPPIITPPSPTITPFGSSDPPTITPSPPSIPPSSPPTKLSGGRASAGAPCSSLSLSADNEPPEKKSRYVTRSRKRGSSGIVAQITQSFAARMELRSPRLKEADTIQGGSAGALTEEKGEGEGEGVVGEGMVGGGGSSGSGSTTGSAGGKTECAEGAVEDVKVKNKDTVEPGRRGRERRGSRSGRNVHRKEEQEMQIRATRSSGRRLARENGDTPGDSEGPEVGLQEPESGQAAEEATAPLTEQTESQARGREPHSANAETVEELGEEKMNTGQVVVGEANMCVVAGGHMDVVPAGEEERGISGGPVATCTSSSRACEKEGPAYTGHGEVTTICRDASSDSATSGADLSSEQAGLTPGQTDHSAGEAGLTTGQTDHSAGEAGLTTGQTDHSAGEAGLTTGQTDHSAGEAGLTTGQTDHSAGEAGLTTGQTDHSAGEAGLTTGQTDHSAGQTNHSTGQAGLTTGQAGLTAGQAGLTTGQAGLTAGQAVHSTGAVSEAAGEEVSVTAEGAEERAKTSHGAGADGDMEDASCNGEPTLQLRIQRSMSTVEALMVLNYNLKASLTAQAPDVRTAQAVLNKLLAMQYTSQDLRQVPDLVTSVRKVHRYYGNEKVRSAAQQLYSAMKSSFLSPGQPAPMRGQGSGQRRPMMTSRGGAGGHAPSRLGSRAGGKGKAGGRSAPVKVSAVPQVAPRRSMRDKQAVDYSQLEDCSGNGGDDQTVPSLNKNQTQ